MPKQYSQLFNDESYIGSNWKYINYAISKMIQPFQLLADISITFYKYSNTDESPFGVHDIFECMISLLGLGLSIDWDD